MKLFIFFFLSLTAYGQTAQELRDMLNGSSFEQYEKMFDNIIKDMEQLDRSQFEEYNRLFDKSIMNQLQFFGSQRKTYEWIETKSERIISFTGRLNESAAPVIEIKDDFFEIKGEFVTQTNYNGNKNISKTILNLKVSLPKDIDSSKVRYENKDNSFLVIFPKKNTASKVNKPLRSPLKENKSDITI